MADANTGRFAESYAALEKMRGMMETMKKNQSYRGVEGLKERMAARAKHTSWRQMKGIELAMHEINHPGNKPFMIGLAITTSVFMYAYFQGLKSEEAKKQSKYYQRFIAKHDDHAVGDHHH